MSNLERAMIMLDSRSVAEGRNPALACSAFPAGDKLRRECVPGTHDRRDMRGAEMHGKEQSLALGAVVQHQPARDTCLIRQLQKPEFQCGA